MAPYNLESFENETEADFEWRFDEIRQFQRLLNDEGETEILRKAFVTALYAHFEGATKDLFTRYIRVINEQLIKSGRAAPALVLSAWHTHFRGLSDPLFMPAFYRDLKLPDEQGLARLGRELHFVANIRSAMREVVALDAEIASPEDNLKPKVLRKICFRLGIEIASLEPYTPQINMLLGKRNPYAHGRRLSAPSSEECDELAQAVQKLLSELRTIIRQAITGRHYLRKRHAPAADRAAVRP